jgi:hypothetical protein
VPYHGVWAGILFVQKSVRAFVVCGTLSVTAGLLLRVTKLQNLTDTFSTSIERLLGMQASGGAGADGGECPQSIMHAACSLSTQLHTIGLTIGSENKSEPQAIRSRSRSCTRLRKKGYVPCLSPGQVTGHVAEMPGTLIYTFLQRWKTKDNGYLLPKNKFTRHRKHYRTVVLGVFSSYY